MRGDGLLGSPRPLDGLEGALRAGKCTPRRAFKALAAVWVVSSLALVLLFVHFSEWPEQRLGVDEAPVHHWTNVHGSVGCTVVGFHTPRSEKELVELVRHASRMRQKVRVVGAGLSWSPLVCDEEDRGVQLVSLRDYATLLEVDREELTATAQAGVTLEQLDLQLRMRYRMALGPAGELGDPTLGGAVSTGTHGSGAAAPSLSAQVEELTLIDSKGRVVRASRRENSDVFAAAAHGVGAVGLLSTVTLRCVRAHNVVQGEALFDTPGRALNAADDLLAAHSSVSFHWTPHADTVRAALFDTTDARLDVPDGLIDQYPVADYWAGPRLRARVSAFVFGVEAYLPFLTPSLHRSALPSSLRPPVEAAPSLVQHAVPQPGAASYASEWFVARDDARRAFDDVRTVVARELRAGGLNLNAAVTLRFVQADDLYLSPAYGRDSAAIGLQLHHQSSLPDRAEAALFEALSAYGARPHWGMCVSRFFTPEYLASALPRFQDFKDVRRRVDPEGTFGSAWSAPLFTDSIEYLESLDARREQEAVERREAEEAARREELEEERAKRAEKAAHEETRKEQNAKADESERANEEHVKSVRRDEEDRRRAADLVAQGKESATKKAESDRKGESREKRVARDREAKAAAGREADEKQQALEEAQKDADEKLRQRKKPREPKPPHAQAAKVPKPRGGKGGRGGRGGRGGGGGGGGAKPRPSEAERKRQERERVEAAEAEVAKRAEADEEAAKQKQREEEEQRDPEKVEAERRKAQATEQIAKSKENTRKSRNKEARRKRRAEL